MDQTEQGVTSVLTASLVYDDARQGINWLIDVLGFRAASIYDRPDGGVAFAELAWRNAIVFVSDRPPADNPWSQVGPVSIALAAEDSEAVDRYYERAVAVGAEIVRPIHDVKTPAFPDGSHQFDVKDPGGNLWTIGTFQPRVLMERTGDPPYEDKVTQFAEQVWMYALGANVAAMNYLGGSLGLYAAMRGAGPLTASEVAERSGLHERWVLEWLRVQAAANLIGYAGNDRFELSDVQAAVLADDASPFYLGAMFGRLPSTLRRLDQLPESFRTGLGSAWGELSDDGVKENADGMLAQFHRTQLVPNVLPALEGVVEVLEAGGKVADIGCGTGVALMEIAKAFPHADLHGFDPWAEGLDFAQRRARESGFSNIAFHESGAEDIPADAGFDLVCAMDCIHDMPRPAEALAAMRRALKPDGTLLIVDIKGGATFEENLETMGVGAAFAYSVSVLRCLASGMSEQGGAGLGTLGFDEATAHRMTAEAGFTRFRALELDHWFNAAYEVRP